MYLYHCDHYQYHYALARRLVPHVKNHMVWRSFLIKHQKLEDMFVSFYFVLKGHSSLKLGQL